MSVSQEVIALRATIWEALRPDEIRTVNFVALVNAAAPAMDRGWTGVEIGKAAVENLEGAESIGAIMLTAIRELGTIDPPRPDATPTPPSIADVREGMYAHHIPATPEQASEWVRRIKAKLAPKPLTEDEREQAAALIGRQRAT